MMNWEEYKQAFIDEARKVHKHPQYLEKHLAYAENLWKQNLPVIYDQKHLCLLLGYSPRYVYAASNSQKHFYRCFDIPKKNGGKRMICEPLPSLKEIQRWILDYILVKIEVSPYAKAYIRGKSLKENVRFHKRQKIVLSLDIHDFFGHISDYMVFQVFIGIGYRTDVAMMLTELCCLDHKLPQGAPTSACLSNIVMKKFDSAVSGYTKELSIRYTRYADDMTFSGDFDTDELVGIVKKQLRPYGMTLNSDKTRIRRSGQRQEVTGIVVNDHMQIPRNSRRQIRQIMFYIEKYGLESHLEHIGAPKKQYLKHLAGVIGYALFINPKDMELQKYKKQIMELIKTDLL